MTIGEAQFNSDQMPGAASAHSSSKRFVHDKETYQALIAMQAQVSKKTTSTYPMADMRTQLSQQLETMLNMIIEIIDELDSLILTDQGFSRENIYLFAHAKSMVHTINQFLCWIDGEAN